MLESWYALPLVDSDPDAHKRALAAIEGDPAAALGRLHQHFQTATLAELFAACKNLHTGRAPDLTFVESDVSDYESGRGVPSYVVRVFVRLTENDKRGRELLPAV